jgi:hypothetical protein
MSKQPIPNAKPAKSENLIYKNHHHNINASIKNLFKCNPKRNLKKEKKKRELITPLLLSRYNY